MTAIVYGLKGTELDHARTKEKVIPGIIMCVTARDLTKEPLKPWELKEIQQQLDGELQRRFGTRRER